MTMIHYPVSPHKQKCYKDWNNLGLPVTERIHAQELSLPVNPLLSDEEVEKVIKAVNTFR